MDILHYKRNINIQNLKTKNHRIMSEYNDIEFYGVIEENDKILICLAALLHDADDKKLFKI